MVNGTEPSCDDAPRSGKSAALAERLAAVEVGIRDDRHRQPTGVLEEIARLWTAGATVSEVAAGAGVSPHIVRDRLRRAGVLDSAPQSPAPGRRAGHDRTAAGRFVEVCLHRGR
ncbi:MAG: hypothetical protein ABFC89_11460 [Methanospirillum sp.]